MSCRPKFFCGCGNPREVAPPAAFACARAIGRVLCDRCRREQFGESWPCIHSLPKGTTARLRCSGYGRFVAELVTSLGVYHGAGATDHGALRVATAAARAAGAIH